MVSSAVKTVSESALTVKILKEIIDRRWGGGVIPPLILHAVLTLFSLQVPNIFELKFLNLKISTNRITRSVDPNLHATDWWGLHGCLAKLLPAPK